MLNGLFVDDRAAEESFARRMTTSGERGLRVTFMLLNKKASLSQSAEEIFSQEPAIVALDYRLDETPGDNQYKASPLAQQLRELAIDSPGQDFPIILVTNEKFYKDFKKRDLAAHDLFDRIYIKQRVTENSNRIKKEIFSLASGYKTLIGFWKRRSPQGNRVALALELEKGERRVIQHNALTKLDEYRCRAQKPDPGCFS